MCLHAQIKINPKQMNYFTNGKPYNIFYNDTIYMGAKQFKQLFLRTGDAQLIHLYHQHQTNKIIGQIVFSAGIASTYVALLGNNVSNNSKWIGAVGGVFAMIAGTIEITKAYQALQKAVFLFNQKHNTISANASITSNGIGLTFNF